MKTTAVLDMEKVRKGFSYYPYISDDITMTVSKEKKKVETKLVRGLYYEKQVYLFNPDKKEFYLYSDNKSKYYKNRFRKSKNTTIIYRCKWKF